MVNFPQNWKKQWKTPIFLQKNIPLNTDLTTEAFSLLRQAMKARCHSSFTTYSQIKNWHLIEGKFKYFEIKCRIKMNMKKKEKKKPVVNAYEWANLIPRLIRLNYM